MALQAAGLPREMLGLRVQGASPAVGDQKGNGERVLGRRAFVGSWKGQREIISVFVAI